MNNGFLVHVQYASASCIVVTPSGKNFGGKMVVTIARHFPNKG